jgi:hypothetical protein
MKEKQVIHQPIGQAAPADIQSTRRNVVRLRTSQMMIGERPSRVNGFMRPKLGSLEGLLAQSASAAKSFGPRMGFVLLLTAMLMQWTARMSIIGLAMLLSVKYGVALKELIP